MMVLAYALGPTMGLVFLEPVALIGLVAPFVLLALGLRRQESREVYLGTTRLLSAQEAGEAGARKRSLPAWLVAAAIATALGVLALAKPGYEGAPPQGVVVELVVDQSPSMYLPLQAQGAATPATRRIDAAWEAFGRWADGHEADITGGVYVTTGAGDPVPWQDVPVPDEPETAAPEVLWQAHDAASTVWITDRGVDDQDRGSAGLFASGGEAIPGPVSVGAQGEIYWKADGTSEFREVSGQGQGQAGVVRLDPDVPRVLRDLAGVWADVRGMRLEMSEGAGDEPELWVGMASTGAPPEPSPGTGGTGSTSVRVGRDGWEADVSLSGSEGAAPRLGDGWGPWLLDPAGQALVTMAPGQVELGFADFQGQPSDEAAFAVSWIGLFDRARLSPNRVVEPSERRAAGSAVAIPPSEPAVLEAPGAAALRDQQAERAAALRALLAGAAALAGLVALVLLVLRK